MIKKCYFLLFFVLFLLVVSLNSNNTINNVENEDHSFINEINCEKDSSYDINEAYGVKFSKSKLQRIENSLKKTIYYF